MNFPRKIIRYHAFFSVGLPDAGTQTVISDFGRFIISGGRLVIFNSQAYEPLLPNGTNFN